VGLGEIVRDGEKTRFARRMRRNMTPAEVLLWSKLRRGSQGWRFRRQPPVGPYVLDFACLEIRLAIEIDGATHASDDEVAHDARRTRYLEERSWRVVRFWNREVFENLAGVVDTIRNAALEQENWLAKSREFP
jgi:very-short-patch-repair endonuclease